MTINLSTYKITGPAGILPVTNGGTGASTSTAAFDALTPTQTGMNGKLLTTNGTTTSWIDPPVALPSQTSNTDKVLTTNGTTASWTNSLINKQLQNYTETVVNATITTSTYNLDISQANIFNITLNLSTTITFTNPPSSGILKNVMLILTQGTGGSKTCAITGGKYTDGVVPILSTTAGQIDVLTFFTINGGTTYMGTFAMANVS